VKKTIPLISDQPRDSSVSEWAPFVLPDRSERSVRSLLRVLGRAVEKVILSHQTKRSRFLSSGFFCFWLGAKIVTFPGASPQNLGFSSDRVAPNSSLPPLTSFELSSTTPADTYFCPRFNFYFAQVQHGFLTSVREHDSSVLKCSI
jgi:hypothetical protein